MYVKYSSNNSNGQWWLNDDDWRALEAAGWDVHWFAQYESQLGIDAAGRFLGALANIAERHGVSLSEAIAEWEHITGQDSAELGCRCCGMPHFFVQYNEDGTYATLQNL